MASHEKETAIPPFAQKSREPRPRVGEILVYEPDRGQGLVYSLREGRVLPFKLSDSPGLPSDLLRPGIQVHFFTAPDNSGEKSAVQLSLEAVASLDARLRYVAKRASRRGQVAGPTGHAGSGTGEESSSEGLNDIAFMRAGVSQVSTRGRRGFGGSRRERERMPEDREQEGSRPGEKKEEPDGAEEATEGEYSEPSEPSQAWVAQEGRDRDEHPEEVVSPEP